jgi:N-acetylmuramoyl-L-alanine amidase
MTKKEPPDKYRCIKVPFSNILYKDKPEETNELFNTLQNSIIRTNNITFKAYFLLRLWILQKYHNNQEIPDITDNIVSIALLSIQKLGKGNKPKGDNLLLLQEFQKVYNFSLEDGLNLSSILSYYKTTMMTSIENNIKIRFFDYIKRFINSYFKHLYQEQMEDKEFKKQLFKELNVVKNDILNNTLTCDKKYHTWINEYRNKIVPIEFEKSYYYDITITPSKYLKYMIFMCLELEKIERKSFQFFPIQTNCIPLHIQLDTKAVIELFVDTDKHKKLIDSCIIKEKTKKNGEIKTTKTKGDLYDNIEPNKEIIWDKFFNITQELKRYTFDYTIITDGYSVSLRFLHRNYVKEQEDKKKKMKDGKRALRGLTKEEKETKKEEKQKQQKEKQKEKKPEKNKKEKQKEEQEFPYIDEIPKEQLEGKHIFIDPGKRSLLTMIDDEGKFFTYTNKQRIYETQRLKIQKKLKKIKQDLRITEIENTLTGYNSKSCNIDKFKEYIEAKLKVNEKVVPLYQSIPFRKYKWYSYINTRRSEDRMLNKIEKRYSKDHIIIIGDWSIGKQMRNFISTPNLSIKRKLKERFRVYNIDEFRTSCLCYKTESECENLYLPDKKKKERKIHSILTYKMENNRKGCINRDRNGCINIRKIFNSYLEKNEIPEKYRRETKLLKTIKVPNRRKTPSNEEITS